MKQLDWEIVDAIPGWFSRAEADLYLEHLEGRWCEVGTWQGRSARCLASSGYPGVAVDWFSGSEGHGVERKDPETLEANWRFNLRDFPVELVVGDFREAADKIGGYFQFLHLDAEHTYESTRDALALYSPKLMDGGVLALHDAWGEDGNRNWTAWPGSQKVMKELDCRQWEHLGDAERSALFRKL